MPFSNVRKGSRSDAIDVSRFGKPPWNRLSPFHLYDSLIPVPGSDLFSRSVEGIWQGLKRIAGQTETAQFKRQARKRRGKPQGHEYAYRLLDYDEAKALVYIPSYLFVLQNLETELVAGLRNAGAQVSVHDVSYQPDCLGPRPISHAALLTDFLNGELQPYVQAQQSIEKLRECELKVLEGRIHELLPARPLTDYRACADLFEKESLMLLAIKKAQAKGDANGWITHLVSEGLLLPGHVEGLLRWGQG